MRHGPSIFTTMKLREQIITGLMCVAVVLGVNYLRLSVGSCSGSSALLLASTSSPRELPGVADSAELRSASKSPAPSSLPAWKLNAVAPLHAVAPRNFMAVMTAAMAGNEELRSVREEEYRVGLRYFFERFQTVMCVASETTAWPLLDALPFHPLLYHTSQQYTGKGAKESEGLRALVRAVNATIEAKFNASEVVVFKASARYHVVRDEALQAVIDNPNHDIWYLPFGNWYHDSHGTLMFDEGDRLGMTFFIAMRWSFFRDFYMNADLERLNSGKNTQTGTNIGYDVERLIVDYADAVHARKFHFKQIHVVAKIGAQKRAQYF